MTSTQMKDETTVQRATEDAYSFVYRASVSQSKRTGKRDRAHLVMTRR